MVTFLLVIAMFNAVLIIVITALELHERVLQKQAKQSSLQSDWKQKNNNIRLQGSKQTANRKEATVPELFQTAYIKAEYIA